MNDRRIVDIGPLLDDLKKELDEECDHPTAVCSDEAVADEIDMLEALPVIDPKELLSMLWRDTKTDPPKNEDADQDGKVLVWRKDLWTASMSPWYFTANRPDYYPYWMPLPEPPEVFGQQTLLHK